MGVNLSAGGSLQWFRNALCQADVADGQEGQDRRLRPADRGGRQAVRPGSEGLFFLPYLSGERTPHADPDARGCFVGLTLAHGRGHLIRAIMEGVTYSMRDSLAIIEGLGVPVQQIRASGGGSRSPLVAADPGRRVRPQGRHDQHRGRAGLRRGPAGGRRRRGVQEHRRGLRGHDPRGPGDRPEPRRPRSVYDRAFPIYQQLYRSLKDDFKTHRGAGEIADVSVVHVPAEHA